MKSFPSCAHSAAPRCASSPSSPTRPTIHDILVHLFIIMGESTASPRIAPPARRCGICAMPGRAASTPSPHRSTNSINASFGSPSVDRRSRTTPDRRAYGTLTLAKRQMRAITASRRRPSPSFPSPRASQAVLRYSRRRVEASDSLSLQHQCLAALKRLGYMPNASIFRAPGPRQNVASHSRASHIGQ